MIKITKEQALKALDNLDDYARMADIEPIGSVSILREYIEQAAECMYILEDLEK